MLGLYGGSSTARSSAYTTDGSSDDEADDFASKASASAYVSAKGGYSDADASISPYVYDESSSESGSESEGEDVDKPAGPTAGEYIEDGSGGEEAATFPGGVRTVDAVVSEIGAGPAPPPPPPASGVRTAVGNVPGSATEVSPDRDLSWFASDDGGRVSAILRKREHKRRYLHGSFNRRFQDALDELRLREVEAANTGPGAFTWWRVLGATGGRFSSGPSFARLTEAYKDFIYTSQLHARVIVSELHLPEGQKTIKPVRSLGGLAGGDKFVAGSILFKVAASGGIFDSAETSAKVANHELRGLVCLFDVLLDPMFSSRVAETRMALPLAAVLDFRGQRVFAETLVPIDGGSRVYGTPDGGRSILGLENLEPAEATLMRAIGSRINTKEHTCLGRSTQVRARVVGPADLELHRGRDKRLYLLDVSRMMPPWAPLKTPREPLSHLYELLRPEFVVQIDGPLSSDGFSGFVVREERDADNLELQQATQRLLAVSVESVAASVTAYIATEWRAWACASPSAQAHARGGFSATATQAQLLESLAQWSSQMCEDCCRLMHREGVNLRLLGVVRLSVLRVGGPTARLAGDIMLIEMVARGAKILLRRGLRNSQATSRGVVDESLMMRCRLLLNLLFGRARPPFVGSLRTSFFTTVLGPLLSEKYFRPEWLQKGGHSRPASTEYPGGMAFSDLFDYLRTKAVQSALPPPDNRPQLRERSLAEIREQSVPHLGCATFATLFGRFVDMTGIRFRSHVLRERAQLVKFFSRPEPFQPGDVEAIAVQVKSLSVVERALGAEAMGRAAKALRTNRVDEAELEYRAAFRFYSQVESGSALASAAATLRVAASLMGLASCLLRRAENSGTKSQVHGSGLFDSLLDETQGLVDICCQREPRNIEVQLTAAMFAEELRRDFSEASQRFGRVLEIDPSHTQAIEGVQRCQVRIAAQARPVLTDRRTGDSETHPILTDFIDLTPFCEQTGAGKLGLTFAPGKQQAGAMTGISWKRSVELDLARLKNLYEANVLVSTMSDEQYQDLQVRALPSACADASLAYLRFSPFVTNYQDEDLAEGVRRRQDFVREVAQLVLEGKNVVVFDQSGLAGAAVLAALVLRYLRPSCDPTEAISAVRTARRGAISTSFQKSFVESFALD
jgi:Clustered mitochondria/Translation initiation factor eIF3 subunit 135